MGDPGDGRVGRAAREVDATAFDLDLKEEDVVAAQGERFDGEEVAGEDARCLLTEELAPARSDPPRRRVQSRGERIHQDAAGRDPKSELLEFSDDQRVAPARVLAGEPSDKLTDSLLERRPPWPTRWLWCPRRRTSSRCQRQKSVCGVTQQSTATIRRQQPRERSEKGTIGRPQPRPGLLAAERLSSWRSASSSTSRASNTLAASRRAAPRRRRDRERRAASVDPHRAALDCQPLLRGRLSACKLIVDRTVVGAIVRPTLGARPAAR